MPRPRHSWSSGGTGGAGTTTVVLPGDSDAIVPQGTQTETMTPSLATELAQGSETVSLNHVTAPSVSVGSETETLGSENIASIGADDLGSAQEESLASVVGATDPIPHGSDTDAFQADALGVITDTTSSAVGVINSGSTNWTNPTNAQGLPNGTEAQFSLSAGLALTTGDADLRCSIPGAVTPTGFTRSAITIRIVYRWELAIAVPLVDTARVVVTLRDSAGALIATLRTRTEDDVDTTQPTLVVEDYDVTGIVSDPQLAAGLQVRFNASASLATAVSGNMSVQVDCALLLTSYTRTGIV